VILDEYFLKGREMLQSKGALSPDFLAKIVREHGGLSHSLWKKYGKSLHKSEALSYFFEALPIAIERWDESKGKAGTALTMGFCLLMSRRNERETYRGCVRVPTSNKNRFAGLSLNVLDSDITDTTINEGVQYAEIASRNERKKAKSKEEG